MTDETKDPIYITAVDIEMMSRLRFARVELTPEGQLIRITGECGAGKSSFVQAMEGTLRGAKKVSDVPVCDESENGTGHGGLELSNDFTIIRAIDAEKNPKGVLKIVGPDGGKHGQARINEWLGDYDDFDAFSFHGLSLARKVEILFGLSSDPDLKAKVDDCRTRHGVLYDERTPHNSDRTAYGKTKKPKGERPEAVDVSAQMERLRALQAEEREQGDARKPLREIEIAQQRNGEALKIASTRIIELEKELRTAREKLGSLNHRGGELERQRVTAQEALGQLPPIAPRMEVVQARINEADAINKLLEPWNEFDRAQEKLVVANAEIGRIETLMLAVRREEAAFIVSANIPIEGLTFEGGEPCLNGRPLSVASGGESALFTINVAVAANPQLRVILISEGDALDLNMLREVARIAKERGFQVFLCRIGIEGAGEIVVEDGVARTNEAPVAL